MFVALALFGLGSGLGGLVQLARLVLSGVVLDLCGLAALGAGIGAGSLPPTVSFSTSLALVCSTMS